VCEQLKSLSLDICYYKGEGNYLFYNDKGQEIKVLDLLGGFGTLIFGHNNCKLSTIVRESLENKTPFAVQGSDRAESGELAAEPK
jgi:glutamate-1-semialdehyde aminotransferase